MLKIKFLRHINLVMSLFLLFQLGCAKSSDPEVVVVNPAKSVRLVMFSAPWCGECSPKIHAVNDILAGVASQVKGTVYMVEGKRPHSEPTPEILKEYAAKIAVPYTFLIDPWRWTNYSLYYTDHQFAIPGCVLQDSNGKLIEVFERGTFLPEEVLGAVKAALQ